MALYRDDPFQRLASSLADPSAPTAPPEQLLTPEQLAYAADEQYAQNQSEVGRAFTQGLENMRATGYAARGLARIPLDEAGGLRDLQRSNEISERAAHFGPEIQNFDQIESAGDFGSWLVNNTATQLPNIALAAGTGGIGAAARVGVGTLARTAATRAAAGEVASSLGARQVFKEGADAVLDRTKTKVAEGTTDAARNRMAQDAAAGTFEETARRRVGALLPDRNVGREIAQGAAVGGAAAGVGMQTSMAPDIVLDPEGEGTVQSRAAVAAIGALATGSLEALPVMRLLGRYTGGEATKAITGGVVSRMAQQAGRQGLTEASTEVMQTMGEKIAHNYVNENVQVLGPEAYGDYLNAAAGGFFGGAVFGAPAGIRGGGTKSPAYAPMRARIESIMDSITPNFRTPGEPMGDAAGAAPGPTPPGGAGGGTTAGSAADRVRAAFDTAAQRTKGAVADLDARTGPAFRTAEEKTRAAAGATVDKVTDYYNRFFGGQSRESSVDNVMNEMFDEVYAATPLDYQSENGEAIFNRPFNQFVDSARARAAVSAGWATDIAVVASTVPADREAALMQSGALRAAADALRGDALTSVNLDALREYTDALSPASRNMFIRTTATMQELAAADFIQRGEDGRATNAQIAAPIANDPDADNLMSDYDVNENTSEPTPLRDPQKTYTAMMKGLPASSTKVAAGSVPITDKSGRTRYATGKKMGAMLSEIKNDPDFKDMTSSMPAREKNVAALAQLAAEVQLGGGQLDLTQLRAGMVMGRDWKLLPADVAQIQQAAVAEQYAGGSNRARTAALPLAEGVASLQPNRNAPRTTGMALDRMDTARQREAELNREYGTGDQVETQRGEEDVLDASRRLGPRTRVPSSLPSVRVRNEGVVGEMVETGRSERPNRANPTSEDASTSRPASVSLTEAQTADAYDTDIDADAAATEREQYSDDAFTKVDRLLRRYTNEDVNGDFDRREELMQRALNEGKVVTTSRARNHIVDGEVRRGAQKRRVRKLGPTERKELLDAEREYVFATHSAAVNKKKSLTKQIARVEKGTAREKFLRGELAGNAKQLSALEAKVRWYDKRDADNVQDKVAADRKQSVKDAADRSTTRARVDAARRERTAAALDAENARNAKTVEKSADLEREMNTEEMISAGIPKTRSRRELDSLAQRVVNAKGISEAKRISLLEQIVARRDEIKRSLSSGAAAERARNVRRTSSDLFNKVDAALNKVMAAKETPTLRAALQAVRALATPAQQRLIDTLVSMGAIDGVKFTTDPSAMAPGVTRAGIAPGVVGGGHISTAKKSGLDGTVVIAMSLFDAPEGNRDPIQTLIHESIHAATSAAEMVNPTLRRDIKKMLDHARKHAPSLGIDPDQWYGMAETQEFLAEAFTNPDFQRILSAMPAADTSTFKNLWHQFRDFVAKLMGVAGKDASLLDEVFTVGLEAARHTAEMRQDAIYERLGLGAASVEASADFQNGSANAGGTGMTPVAGSKPTDYMTMLPPRERLRMLRVLSRPDVRRAILAAVPADQHHILNSADLGPTLYVNTGLALAMAGKVDLNRAQTSSIRQLGDAIRNVLQIPSSQTYARQILADLKAGKVDRKYDSRKSLLSPAGLAIHQFVESKIAPLVQAVASDMDARMRATNVPALTELATLISQRSGEFRADQGSSYLARRNRTRAQKLNEFYDLIEGWDDKKKAQLVRALQTQQRDSFVTGTDPKTGAKMFDDATGDLAKVYDFFEGMHDYLQGAGVKLGKTKNYFPVSIDPEALAAKKDEFIALMNEPEFAPHLVAMGGAEALYQKAVSSIKGNEQTVGDVSFGEGANAPGMRALNARLSAFVYKHGTDAQKAKFAEFQDPSLERIAVNYINRAVSRAEWDRSRLDQRIKSLRDKALAQGATAADMRLATDYVDQAMGVYGQDWHPAIKRVFTGMDTVFGTKLADSDFTKVKSLQGAMMTYQNLRLLPLALMSSLIDPLGSSVRSGGQMKHHFKAMREAARAIRESGPPSALRDMAHDMGIIERSAVNEALTYMFGGAHDPSGRMAKINNALFKYNGLEMVTKYSRLTALSMGHKFLLQHAYSPNKHSERALTELGLTAKDIKPDGNGYVVRSAKIDAALWRFVDEAVVRPTPTQRPGWHNDPHFALAAQYKGYLYSFWNTVMRRAATEMKNGNYAVIAPLALYLPVTAVGEMLRDGLQDDDDDRDMVDYSMLAVERSGLLGPKLNLGMSMSNDMDYGSSALNSLAGPSAQQFLDMFDTVAGERRVGKTAVEALPGSALFEDWGK